LGRKDRERFQQMQEQNPDYVGFRGINTVNVRVAPPTTETVICSVCNRKRNVPSDSIPKDVSTYVCLRCQNESGSDGG
jgi:hypothetical protein